MKLSYTYLFLAALLICTACAKKTRKSPNGFEISVVRDGSGDYAQPGSFIVMNMLYKDDKDSVWFDTKKLERPGVVQVPDTSVMKMEKGMENTFRVLKKGDSITFKVMAKSLFEDTWRSQVPPGVKPDSYMHFQIGVKDIVDRDGVNKLQQELQAKEMEKSKKASETQLGIDTLAIDSYLAEHKINAMKTPEGVRYVITKQGSGPSPTIENTVTCNYIGSLLADGTEFQRSTEPLVYGLSGLVPGWQIAFQKLQKGSKATLYIPSGLGYGLNGSPPDIPANANLVFEVELIDFK